MSTPAGSLFSSRIVLNGWSPSVYEQVIIFVVFSAAPPAHESRASRGRARHVADTPDHPTPPPRHSNHQTHHPKCNCSPTWARPSSSLSHLDRENCSASVSLCPIRGSFENIFLTSFGQLHSRLRC